MSTSSVSATAKKRLPPEERKDMLLECTATFLREHGLSVLTMERLAQYAGVSKPLVYNYFPNRMALLKAVLVREVEIRLKLDREVAEQATSLQDLIERSAWNMLTNIRDRGNNVQQLLQEPEIAQVLTEMRSSVRGDYVGFLANQLRSEFDVPSPIAAIVVELLMGMGTTAGALFEREKGDIHKLHEILVTLTQGALDAAVHKYTDDTTSM
ncbi:MAG TPA: hypothetical protein DD437_03770 [Rhodobiaceae bacterium]|nr:hypothetical protein [Rhodobiaceae bacterium]